MPRTKIGGLYFDGANGDGSRDHGGNVDRVLVRRSDDGHELWNANRIMKQRRVVITGMGAVSPFGEGVDCLWNNLRAGCSAVRRVRGPWVSLAGCGVGWQGDGAGGGLVEN